MNRLLIAAALVLGSTVASQAMAQAYAGGSVGVVDYKNLFEGGWENDPGASHDSKGTGFKVFGGYKFNPYFALEGAYVNLGKAKYSYQSSSDAYNHGQGEFKSSGVAVSALGIVPVKDFELFGKLGVSYLQTKDKYFEAYRFGGNIDYSASDNSTNLTFGLGAAYNFTSNLSARVEWERFRAKTDGENLNLNLITVGLGYRF